MNDYRIIPQEIKSEVRIFKFISLKDFMFLIILITVSGNFTNMVHPKLQLFFLIYILVFGFILILPVGEKTNPKRKIYELIFIVTSKSRQVYKPVKEIEYKNV